MFTQNQEYVAGRKRLQEERNRKEGKINKVRRRRMEDMKRCARRELDENLTQKSEQEDKKEEKRKMG
jgi:hypothetical protein